MTEDEDSELDDDIPVMALTKDNMKNLKTFNEADPNSQQPA